MSDTTKQGIKIGAAALLLIIAVFAIRGSFSDELVETVNTRTFMDKDSGELFKIEIKPGAKYFPAENPKTGEMTLYPTEVCFKNECGDAGGTRVILNSLLKKPGPTVCSKCGAFVSSH